MPKTVKPKASSPPLTTPSVRHVPEVSPPKVWPPSINLADRLAQAVKARFFCDAAAAATVETVSVATSPITVPGAATFVPPRRRRLGVVVAAVVRSPSSVAPPWAGRRPPSSPPRRPGRAASRGRSARRARRVRAPHAAAPGLRAARAAAASEALAHRAEAEGRARETRALGPPKSGQAGARLPRGRARRAGLGVAHGTPARRCRPSARRRKLRPPPRTRFCGAAGFGPVRSRFKVAILIFGGCWFEKRFYRGHRPWWPP